jgi:hypothetical protein
MSQVKYQLAASFTLVPSSGSLFDPEDGGDMFLQSVVFSTDYTELQPGRLYFS